MRIALSAGEVSGDRLGAVLAEALRRARPGCEIAGCAGSAMVAAGVRPLERAEWFAVAGWSGVLERLPGLVARGLRLRARLLAWRPDLFVALDAPGLNAPLVSALRRRGVPCAWVAPPQLWAWRDRSPRVLRDLDVFPLHAFERPALERAGARVRWLGHPMADTLRARPPGSEERRFLALLPGTRPAWRARHESLFGVAGERLGRCLGLEPAWAAPGAVGERGARGLRRFDPAALYGQSGLALSLPGTGTLELALQAVPTVVAARPAHLDRWLAERRLDPGSKVLPNRILGTTVFPELYANEAGVAELVAAGTDLFARRAVTIASLAPLDASLGDPGGVDRLAGALLERRAVSSPGSASLQGSWIDPTSPSSAPEADPISRP